MTEENNKELEWIKKHIEFNNSWNGELWETPLHTEFEQYLKSIATENYTNGKPLFFSTIKLNDNAKDILFNNPKLSRVFTILLDSYDDLPYRPEEAFDNCWRAFEILMSIYDKHYECSKICERIKKIYDFEDNITKDTINRLMKLNSLAGNSFMLNKLVDTDHLDISSGETSLIIQDQSYNVQKRVKHAMGNELYEDFAKSYFTRENYTRQGKDKHCNLITINETRNTSLTADNRRKATLFLRDTLIPGKGEKFYIVTKRDEKNPKNNVKKYYDMLGLEKRLELVINGILYTSRCHRFHGDYFSPFKSDRLKMTHYYEYFYFMTFTYGMFWYLLYAFLEDNKIDKFFSISQVNDCLNKSMNNLELLPNKFEDE